MIVSADVRAGGLRRRLLAGGISWATTIGVLAFVLGRSASGSLGAIGFVGLGVAVVFYVVVRVRRHLLARSREAAPGRNVEQVPR
jgi:hypothetical protein